MRAVWETHDGARIFITSAPTFRTGDERYLWLNKILAVGIDRFTDTGLGYRIYRIN